MIYGRQYCPVDQTPKGEVGGSQGTTLAPGFG